MRQDNGERCENCRYAIQSEDLIFCHRYPVAETSQSIQEDTGVGEHGWCGEWQHDGVPWNDKLRESQEAGQVVTNEEEER